MSSDLPVKVQSWELTVYPRSFFGGAERVQPFLQSVQLLTNSGVARSPRTEPPGPLWHALRTGNTQHHYFIG
jgi:hypothetical protein